MANIKFESNAIRRWVSPTLAFHGFFMGRLCGLSYRTTITCKNSSGFPHFIAQTMLRWSFSSNFFYLCNNMTLRIRSLWWGR